MTAPVFPCPTVEAFRAHEAKHGPWMRVKVVDAWIQARVRVVDEERNFPGYLIALLFTSKSDGLDGPSRDVKNYRSFMPDFDTIPEWEWCDADGLPVPDIRSASELTAEQLEAWPGGWCGRYISDGRGTIDLQWHILASLELTRDSSDRRQSLLQRLSDSPIGEVYPVRDRQPWRPARRSEVDVAVAARKGGAL